MMKENLRNEQVCNFCIQPNIMVMMIMAIRTLK